MSNELFSSINLEGPYISECDLFVKTSAPANELACNVQIRTPKNLKLEHDKENGEYELVHAMKVDVSLVEVSEDGNGPEAMHANLTMNGVISITDRVKASEEEIMQSLLVNGVSLFYSSARSYVEILTSMSPMGRFTIPTIDPKAYVESLSKD